MARWPDLPIVPVPHRSNRPAAQLHCCTFHHSPAFTERPLTDPIRFPAAPDGIFVTRPLATGGGHGVCARVARIKWSPELAPCSVANGGMDPVPGYPLDARALHLFENDVDPLYRIHGCASGRELGKAASSGCIRRFNQDAIDLHDRAIHSTSVIVLHSMKPAELAGLY